MVYWFNDNFSKWICQGCPVTDELNEITMLQLVEWNGFTSEMMNKITLFKNLIELYWICCGTNIHDEFPKLPIDVLNRPGFKVHITWDRSAYMQWKENGSDAKLASMVTGLNLSLRRETGLKEEYEFDLFVNLKTLSMRGCGISTIPEEIYNLRELESLDVSNNKIEEISPKINKLVNLRYFSCPGNKISNFPVEICELRQLIYFCYYNNALDVLHPDVIEFMNSMKK